VLERRNVHKIVTRLNEGSLMFVKMSDGCLEDSEL